MVTVVTKQPGETLAYSFDFSARIADAGVALSSITALTATAAGLVSGASAVGVSGQAIDGQGVNVLLSGGTLSEDYVLLCVVVADNGETYELDGLLRIADAASALVVETGAGLANANSYATVAEADAYLRARARATAWDALDLETKAGRLVMATQYLDAAVRWRGVIVRDAQALGWPRSDAVDRESRAIASGVVPAPVRAATIEIAALGEVAVERTRVAISKTVGPISIDYADGVDVAQGPGRYAHALALVSGLATSTASGSIRAVRA